MGLMPGFDGEEGEGEGGDGKGKNDSGSGKKDQEEPRQQAPVDPLLAAMLATVVFDTTPLPAAAVNPLDDSGKSLLKLAPVKAFPSVRRVVFFFLLPTLFFHFFRAIRADTKNSTSSLSPS